MSAEIKEAQLTTTIEAYPHECDDGYNYYMVYRLGNTIIKEDKIYDTELIEAFDLHFKEN